MFNRRPKKRASLRDPSNRFAVISLRNEHNKVLSANRRALTFVLQMNWQKSPNHNVNYECKSAFGSSVRCERILLSSWRIYNLYMRWIEFPTRLPIKWPINHSAPKTKFRSFCCCHSRCRSPIKFFFSPLIRASSSLQNSIVMNGTCVLRTYQSVEHIKITSNLCWKLETTAVGAPLRVRRMFFDYKAKREKHQNVAHFNLLPFLYYY